jgi:glutamine amidotransferase
MISIIDYGMGNLWSVSKGLEKVGAEVVITSDKKKILGSSGIVLPGVGAFHRAMENLYKLKIIPVIKEAIFNGVPFLGICLGHQLLFSSSEEGGNCKGLDIIKGKVKRFKTGLRIPQMGWNEVRAVKISTLLKGIKNPLYMYFAHSYYAQPEDKKCVIAETEYGRKFASAVCQKNVYGIQPHPEKSSDKGLRILKNFYLLTRN